MPPSGSRELVVGSESGPEPPFPVKVNGPIIKGFGRGSREVGV
jgi:riboflavin kinase